MTEPSQGLVSVSAEVFYSDGQFRSISMHDVDFLKSIALKTPRKRARICFHSSPEDAQQEMLIVMHRESYVCPHKHMNKVETLTIIEGECVALLFDEVGQVRKNIRMTAPSKGGAFFYRMPPGQFHSLQFTSKWVVFLETTIGPFSTTASQKASWAPDESEQVKGQEFLKSKHKGYK